VKHINHVCVCFLSCGAFLLLLLLLIIVVGVKVFIRLAINNVCCVEGRQKVIGGKAATFNCCCYPHFAVYIPVSFVFT
jgi:hypothetical protein